jgi:hypothetical protein
VRPEFFTDAIVSRLPTDVRLTYIGLWCVADDAGWLVWDVHQIAVQLYPYDSGRVRERRIERAGLALSEAGRLVMHDCGCAHVPKLADHQKIGGNKSFSALERHQVHTRPNLSPGRVGKVDKLNGRALARDDDETYEADLLAAQRRLGLPVDTAAPSRKMASR